MEILTTTRKKLPSEINLSKMLNRFFKKATPTPLNPAIKVIYFILSKSKDHNLPLDCKLKLFDSMVIPIFLYGSEL